MPMFPCVKLADFLPESDLKDIIIDASTYSNLQLNPLPLMPTFGSCNSSANKDITKILTNGDTIF